MDIGDIDPKEWAAAQRRAEILSKLPERPSGEQIRDAMAALGVGRTTLFRWLKRFRESARTSALAPHARFMIAPSARYFCPRCAQTPAIGRKDAALPWTFWCSAHGVRLWARGKRPMQSFLPERVLERLDPLARRGAARLAAWAGDRDHIGEQGLPTVPDLLQFLTSPYRRASLQILFNPMP